MTAINTAIYNSVSHTTRFLIESSLSVEQNFPSHTPSDVFISNVTDVSIALSDLPYAEIYREIEKSKCYNIKLIDGGLLLLQYSFKKRLLRKHRLAFFPNPKLLSYEEFPEAYDNDEIYGDIVSPRRVVTPIRFDYDPDRASAIFHPVSHLTIGQFKNCRIPVSHPVAPDKFIDFILRSFYYSIYKGNELTIDKSIQFEETITPEEKKILHIRI